MLNFSKDLDFNKIINENELVLFDFGQENCTRCKTLEINIENYLKNNNLLVYYVDVKDNMKLVRSKNIYASPCVLIYYKGEQVYKNLGTFDFNEVINKINELKNKI